MKKKETEIVDDLKIFSNKHNTFDRTAYSVFKSKKLISFLRKNKINSVILSGIDTDACVLASAFEAFDLGFKVFINKMLCASSVGLVAHKNALEISKRNINKNI